MTTKRAAIYCRISSDREGGGLGVKRQEQDCIDLAKRMGLTVTGTYVDNDISAFSGKKRPEYANLLSAIKAGRVDTVLAWHTDRLHRSPKELETYIDASEQNGVSTHTVKAGEIDLSTPSGRAIARTLGAWARYESEHKSERITRKKLELAQAGKFSGGPVPYGWVIVDGVPVIVEADAQEIRKAVGAIIAGESIGSIVKDLNTRKVRTRRGQDWTSTSVRNLVMRPTNAGLTAYRGEIVSKSVFPAIVTEDQWRTASAVVKNPTRRSAFDSKVKHLLAGMMLCGKCAAPMKTSSRGGVVGDHRHYYKCPTTGAGHSFQTAAPVEEFVSEIVLNVLERKEHLSALDRPDDGLMDQLQRDAGTYRGRLGEAADSFADGKISAVQLEAITARITPKLDDVIAHLASIGSGNALASVDLANVRDWWEAASIEKRRAVIDALMVVTVNPVKRGAPRVFNTDRIQIDWRHAESQKAAT